MSVFKYDKDADGIVTVTMDMTGPVNAMNAEFEQAFKETVEKLEAEQGLSGVVLASAKKVFFAGADLKMILNVEPEGQPAFMQWLEDNKAMMRRLETLPVPVVSAINGAALGGGFELCLATNYRIAYNHKSVLLGLPEVGLGLLPGGGGIVRLVNMLGLEKALPHFMEGRNMSPAKALEAGLIDETVDSLDELLPRAKAYILENKDNEDAVVKPWDKKGFKIPGGKTGSPQLAQTIMFTPPMLLQKTRGLMPAPEVILDCAVEAARLDFDTAMRIESRGLTQLVVTPEAKNMVTNFFQLNKVNGGASRPKDIAPSKVAKVGIIGAGMMGQGIAYSSAMSGIEVVLKDISQEAAEKGKAYTEKLLDKRVAKGRMDQAKRDAVLGLITATDQMSDLAGCDLIIEAVFENVELKNKIVTESESALAEGGLWASNTSTLPITQLAEASSKPENFIGMHFFSPVDKMPLVEIICGDKTSDEALAKAFDFTRQIRKTPIVVNDSLGFFTSRTCLSYMDEAARLVVEGLHPIKIDNLGKAVGMPVGPLTLSDEVSLKLMGSIMQTWEEQGRKDAYGEQEAMREVIAKLYNDNDRGGRHHNGGYFEYSAEAGKALWPGVLELFYNAEAEQPEQDIKDRLMFRQVIETLKCLETNVLRSVADGNIGSLMGIGAPTQSGGFLQYINTYGLEAFQARCGELEAAYGERFKCPQIVADKIAAGEQFV